MRYATILTVTAMVPTLAAAATAAEAPPISGAWVADPSSDIVGPAGLTISDRVIAFGPNSEKITQWSAERDLITIRTAIGHSYSFRKESDSRMCLVSSLKPGKLLGAGNAATVRCYSKRTDK
ncbi:hypothetical protein [Sphingomonas oryzagri]